MANKATCTGKTAGGVAVDGFIINDIQGYSVDMNQGQFTAITKNGGAYSIELNGGTVTLTTSINMATKVNSVTVSVA